MPPDEFGEVHFEHRFAPALDLGAWVAATFIAKGGPLHNEDHAHLDEHATLGFMWASLGMRKHGRAVLGLTEDVVNSGKGNAWQRGRAEQQLTEWFGYLPRFLITIDAAFWTQATDADRCALVEHELYHCGHELDEFGEPKYGKDGAPKLAIRGHDVEEFVGVVRRYGLGDPDSSVARLVLAAADTASKIGAGRISAACGTCMGLR
jgi:hypothetical protein